MRKGTNQECFAGVDSDLIEYMHERIGDDTTHLGVLVHSLYRQSASEVVTQHDASDTSDLHRMCFASACLAIGKNRAIVTFHHTLH